MENVTLYGLSDKDLRRWDQLRLLDAYMAAVSTSTTGRNLFTDTRPARRIYRFT